MNILKLKDQIENWLNNVPDSIPPTDEELLIAYYVWTWHNQDNSDYILSQLNFLGYFEPEYIQKISK